MRKRIAISLVILAIALLIVKQTAKAPAEEQLPQPSCGVRQPGGFMVPCETTGANSLEKDLLKIYKKDYNCEMYTGQEAEMCFGDWEMYKSNFSGISNSYGD